MDSVASRAWTDPTRPTRPTGGDGTAGMHVCLARAAGRERGRAAVLRPAMDMRGGAQRAHPPSRGTRARTGAQSSVQFSTGALVRAPQLRGARLPLPICPLRRRFCPASRHAAQARGRRSEEAGSPSTRRRHDLEGWLAEAPPARPERARDDRVAEQEAARVAAKKQPR